MLCLSDFELHSRWVALQIERGKSYDNPLIIYMNKFTGQN